MIRLQRVGRKNDPSFRIVVTDSKNGPKAGKFIEIVGAHDARKGNPRIDADRVKYWMSVGAQVSDTVNNLLVKHKVIEGKKIAPFTPKAKVVEPEVVAEAPKVEEAPAEETAVDLPAEVLTKEGFNFWNQVHPSPFRGLRRTLNFLTKSKISRKLVVGLGRLELPTPRLSSVCSNQLSYRPLGLPHAAFFVYLFRMNPLNEKTKP